MSRPVITAQAPHFIFQAAQASRLNQDGVHPDSKSFTASEVRFLAQTLRSFWETKGQGPYLSREDGPIVRRHRSTGFRQGVSQARGILLDQLLQEKDPWLLTRWSRSAAQDTLERTIFSLEQALLLNIFHLDVEELLDIESWKTPIPFCEKCRSRLEEAGDDCQTCEVRTAPGLPPCG